MQVGDLVKFKRLSYEANINNKTAIYLGEDFIHRDDGVVVQNHKVLVHGESTPTIIDRTVLKYMEVISSESR